jgi:hypothetical protein
MLTDYFYRQRTKPFITTPIVLIAREGEASSC